MNAALSKGALRSALVSETARALMLLCLTVIAVTAAASAAAAFLAPILFALVVGVVVAPFADRMNEIGIPRVVTASGVLLVVVLCLVTAFVMMEPLLTSLAKQWPLLRAEIQSWFFALSDIFRGVETLSDEIERTVGVDASGNDGKKADIPSIMDAVWVAPGIGAKVFVFIGTLFFFVLTRGEIYGFAGRYSGALFSAERAVAKYFAIVSTINLGLGAATGLALTLLGVQGALVWGLVAAGMNFILYLGPLLVAVGLLVVGLIQFNGAMVLAPPAAFLFLNMLEAQFVTPTLVGQQLHMNPLGVFLAITFGLWLWGPIGAIVALPVTLWITVLLSKTAQLEATPHPTFEIP